MDAVFDPIGGPNWRRSFQTLNSKGRFVGYGYTSVLEDAEQEDWENEWKSMAERKQMERGNAAYLYSITNLRKEHPGGSGRM
jgi:NADPH:quinone reductase-like Zn-dependent oxidoreductase